MHKRLVSYIVSRVLLVMSCVMVVPLGWALWDNPRSVEVAAFSVSILLGIGLSILVRCVLHGSIQDLGRLNAKDGLSIVGLSWIAIETRATPGV